MKQIFLSYSRLDAEHARRLFDDLNSAPGVRVWFDQVDLAPGMKWRPAIRNAIRESSYFAALLSSRSVSAQGFQEEEMRQAIEVAREFPENHVYLIPVRLDECEPPFEFLAEFTYADLFPDWEAGLADLMRGLGVSASATQRPGPAPGGRTFSFVPAESRPRPGDYLYRVELVDLGARTEELVSVADGLNQEQRLCYLNASSMAPDSAAFVVEKDLPQLDTTRLSQRFFAALAPQQVDHILGLTDRYLMAEFEGRIVFNYLGVSSPVDERISFLSVGGLREFARLADVSYRVALAYLLVVDLTSYFLDMPMHSVSRGCPMDFLKQHNEMVMGLQRGKFCDECLGRLQANPTLKEAVVRMLQWGRQPG